MFRNYLTEHFNYLTKPSFYKGIDLLRVIAIVGVLFYHLGSFKIINPYEINKIGWMGVDLFFVLSGFLIGGMLIEEIVDKNKVDYRNFYKKRFLRIYPLYFFITLATMLGNVFVRRATEWDTTEFINQLGPNMLFLQTFIQYNPLYIAGGTWSLVIEEFFYLFAPIVLLLIMKITRCNLTYTFWILVGLYLSGTITRLLVIPDDVNAYFTYITRPYSRYDELIAGILVYLVIRNQWFKKHWGKFLYIGLSLCAAIFVFYHKNPVIFNEPYKMTYEIFYYPLILSFTFGCILLSIYNIKFENIIINVVAKLSYSIYLVHFVLGIYLKDFHTYDQVSKYLIVFLFSYLASLLIEYPFIRIYKSKSKVVIESNVILPNQGNNEKLENATTAAS